MLGAATKRPGLRGAGWEWGGGGLGWAGEEGKGLGWGSAGIAGFGWGDGLVSCVACLESKSKGSPTSFF